MANLNKTLAIIFSILFLYAYTFTESHYRFVPIQKAANNSDNSDLHISGIFLLHAIPFHNNPGKNISSWKSACNWFTRLSPGTLPLSPDLIRNKGSFRLLSRLIALDEVIPNLTVRVKIFPFHYFL